MIKAALILLKKIRTHEKKASLTVEAALVMPVFLYFMIAFLYFIQIFTLQEKIQSEITKMGLSLSKTAYFYKDFPDIGEALSFDKSLFGEDFDIGIDDITDRIIGGCSMKLYAKFYLDKDWINKSCIKDGFEGIDFSGSEISTEDDKIDIILKYQIRIPVKIFIIGDMNMLQRIRLRTWTGNQVTASYSKENKTSEVMVFITRTGTVYHKNKDCTYLKPSVAAVNGIPYNLRNESGAKYYQCESCCNGNEDRNAVYYITTYGNRYHSNQNCPRIKRNIIEIPISEIGNRRPCSRCGG